jgi:murein L,D-transpeptidase YafK
MKKILITIVVALAISFLLLSIKAKKIQHPLSENAVADKILIEKSKRRLTLLKSNVALKTYNVALGRHPEGKKAEEGDGKTPEGTYTIDRRKIKSSYHRALHISYPNASDVAQAKLKGVSPGGDIMIHGLPNILGFVGQFHTVRDWTLGCVAVTNQEIEEIWRTAPDGTPVEIVP